MGRGGRWWLLLALIIGAAVSIPFGKWRVERDLASRSRHALVAAGVQGVDVHLNWADETLCGPAASKDAALAAVLAMADAGDLHRSQLHYRSDCSGARVLPAPTSVAATTVAATTVPATTVATTAAPAPTTVASTTTAATTTTVAAAASAVKADAAVAKGKLTLTGYVESVAQKTAIVDQAVTTFGALNVIDQLVVQAAPATAGAATARDVAVKRFGGIVGAFGARLLKGGADISDTTINVRGTAFTKAGVDALNALGADARAVGVEVKGSLTAAAAASGAELQANLADLLSRSGINFASGSTVITPESAAVLDTAAQSILALPGARVEVGGHTDNLGAAGANLALSQQRAQAVVTYLTGKGVPAAQLSAVGYGQTVPLEDNATEQGRTANRRIEFKVLGS